MLFLVWQLIHRHKKGCLNLPEFEKDQEGSLLKVSKYLRSIRLLLCAKSSSLVDGWAQSLKPKINWLHAMVMSYAMVLSGLEHVKICHNGVREFGSRCGIFRTRKISWLILVAPWVNYGWWLLTRSCGMIRPWKRPSFPASNSKTIPPLVASATPILVDNSW